MASKKNWKEFTQEDYDRIARARQEQQAKNAPFDPKATYKKLCRACDKPNALEVDFCTGCGFSLDDALDRQRQSDNIFLDLIRGENTGTNVLYRDNDYLAFDDKFGVSDNHLDVIPTIVIDDITQLTAEHIPMLERLHELGVAEFERRRQAKYNAAIQLYDGLNFDDYIVSGYNFPVSVKHLHLHIALPPFRHEKVFQYPRWHSHKKVIADLKQHGRVVPYQEQPNDDEGAAVYDTAIRNSRAFAARLAAAASAAGAAAVASTAASGESSDGSDAGSTSKPAASSEVRAMLSDERAQLRKIKWASSADKDVNAFDADRGRPADSSRQQLLWPVAIGTAIAVGVGAFIYYRWYVKNK